MNNPETRRIMPAALLSQINLPAANIPQAPAAMLQKTNCDAFKKYTDIHKHFP